MKPEPDESNLKAENAELKAQVKTLTAENAALKAQVKVLAAEIKTLKALLAKTQRRLEGFMNASDPDGLLKKRLTRS